MKTCILIFTSFLFITAASFGQQLKDTVVDVDGNMYHTVKIGKQIWMQENLKTTKYSDGSPIPKEPNNAKWKKLTTDAYSDYYDKPKMSKQTGRLYNFYAATSPAKICPAGWHVPSNKEWNTLEEYLDNTVDTTITGNLGSDIGGIMKDTGTAHWSAPNTGATNSSHFTALPAGYRNIGGAYLSIGLIGVWWTSSEEDKLNASYRFLTYKNSQINRSFVAKNSGLSIRCVRD